MKFSHFIFMLSCGLATACSSADPNFPREETNRANSTRGTFLEVFDLDGNPVVRYHLDGRRPVYFAVDEETFTLYGAGEGGDPEDNLLVYHLKGLSTLLAEVLHGQTSGKEMKR